MAAMSIHIGLNAVDAAHYEGWAGTLRGCEKDARDMAAIANHGAYESTLLLTKDATADRVIEALRRAAGSLKEQGTLLLTYSGHGGQLPDTSGEEADKQDETWVLYDRMLIDDELFKVWSTFAAGVRIFVLSDSCHSGTILRARILGMNSPAAIELLSKDFSITEHSVPRAIPIDVQNSTYAAHQPQYNEIKSANLADESDVTASVILISGCQDNQTSADGLNNGLFTSALLEVWDNGSFSGDYPKFHQRIVSKMPPVQVPNYYKVGRANAKFESERPFTTSP